MSAWDEVLAELWRAQAKFPAMRSPHEGFAILKEEVDELWDEVKANNAERTREEAVQVAAMALRFLEDVCASDASTNPRPTHGRIDAALSCPHVTVGFGEEIRAECRECGIEMVEVAKHKYEPRSSNPSHDPERCEARIEDYKRALQSCNEGLACANNLRKDAEDELAKLRTGSACPTCGEPLACPGRSFHAGYLKRVEEESAHKASDGGRK